MRSGSKSRLCTISPLPALTGPFASATYVACPFAPSRALRTAAASLWAFSDVCLACAKRSCRQTNNDRERTLDFRSDAACERNDGGHDCHNNGYQADALWISTAVRVANRKPSPLHHLSSRDTGSVRRWLPQSSVAACGNACLRAVNACGRSPYAFIVMRSMTMCPRVGKPGRYRPRGTIPYDPR